MLLVLLCCVGVWTYTFLRGHHKQGQREKKAIAWVEERGGEVEYDEEATKNDWRRQWLGDWYPPVVSGVEFSNWKRLCLRLPKPDVEDLTPLLPLDDLESLHLDQVEVSDLSAIAQMSNLESLSLRYLPASDLTPLGSLTELREFELSYFGGKISRLDFDPASLACLENLESVRLRYVSVPSLAPLAEAKNLRELRLIYTNTDGLEALAGLTQLEVLSVNEDLSSEELRVLRNSNNLRELQVDVEPGFDMTLLGQLSQLEHLSLRSRTDATVYDLASLEELKKLRSLRLTGWAGGRPRITGGAGPVGDAFALGVRPW